MANVEIPEKQIRQSSSSERRLGRGRPGSLEEKSGASCMSQWQNHLKDRLSQCGFRCWGSEIQVDTGGKTTSGMSTDPSLQRCPSIQRDESISKSISKCLLGTCEPDDATQ